MKARAKNNRKARRLSNRKSDNKWLKDVRKIIEQRRRAERRSRRN